MVKWVMRTGGAPTACTHSHIHTRTHTRIHTQSARERAEPSWSSNVAECQNRQLHLTPTGEASRTRTFVTCSCSGGHYLWSWASSASVTSSSNSPCAVADCLHASYWPDRCCCCSFFFFFWSTLPEAFTRLLWWGVSDGTAG